MLLQTASAESPKYGSGGQPRFTEETNIADRQEARRFKGQEVFETETEKSIDPIQRRLS